MPRQQYEQKLRKLQEDLIGLARLVESSVGGAIAAFNAQDVERSRQIIADDHQIDRRQYAIEEQALTLIATQQPLAGDLRAISAAISIASELERMGDYAEGIAEITIRGATQPPIETVADVPQMAELAQQMLRDSLAAYLRRDVEAARALVEHESRMDALTGKVQHELLARMIRDPQQIERAIHLLYVAHNLERIADRTTNIAERVIFMVTGEIIDLND